MCGASDKGDMNSLCHMIMGIRRSALAFVIFVQLKNCVIATHRGSHRIEEDQRLQFLLSAMLSTKNVGSGHVDSFFWPINDESQGL